jgi:acyl carrier protein
VWTGALPDVLESDLNRRSSGPHRQGDPISAAEIRTIIAKIMGRDVVEDTDDPMKDYGADSLDMLELTQTLEDRFGYHIPDDEVDQRRTVGDFIRWYEQHVAMEPDTR